jgi:hypothetical protein
MTLIEDGSDRGVGGRAVRVSVVRARVGPSLNLGVSATLPHVLSQP